MNYTRKTFSVMPGAQTSDERWEATFGKKTRLEPITDPRANPGGRDIGNLTITSRALPDAAVSVTGVWVRTHEVERASGVVTKPLSATMKWTVIEVLVEVVSGGVPEWRLIQSHEVPNIEQTISHITETAGIEKAPVDRL